jgi:hypothetical protein
VVAWFTRSFPNVSRSSAEQWLRIAASQDPPAAALEYRQRDAEYHRTHRERKKLAAPDGPSDRQTENEPGADDDDDDDEKPHPTEETAKQASYNTSFKIFQLRAEMFALAATLRPMDRQQFLKATHEELAAFARKFAPTAESQ